MIPQSSGSLRHTYLQWVEDQIEDFKESIPRSQLLELAEQVIRDLQVTNQGQYQITELLLCEAVDRKIFQILKLPSYRSWSATYRALPVEAEPVVPAFPMAVSM